MVADNVHQSIHFISRKYICGIALLCLVYTAKAQNIKHIVGIDIGYSDYPAIVDFKGEANLNYIFNPYNFMVKAQCGLAPATNFGTMTKAFLSIGYTTKMDRLISWHLLTGVGGIIPGKNSSAYNFVGGPVIVESGFYIKPQKEKIWLLGINASVIPFSYKGIKDFHDYGNGITPCINISYNLILNAKNKKSSQ